MLCNPVVWERKSTRGHCILPKLHRSNVCNRRHKTSLTTVHCIQRPSKRHLGLFCAPVSVNTRKSMTKPWGFTYGRAQKFTDFQGVHNTCGASVLFYSTQHFTCRSNRVQITAGEQNIQGAKRHYYQGCLEQLNACMHAAQSAHVIIQTRIYRLQGQSFIGSSNIFKLRNISY